VPSYEATDWPEVLRLYDLLVSVAPSPARLGRAVAAAEAHGSGAGLVLLDELPPSPRWHAVRAELLAGQGRFAEAADALTRSLTGPVTDPERRYRLRRRAAFLQRGGGGASPESRQG